MKIAKDSLLRVRAGISFALAEALEEGHCGLPQAELLIATEKLLEVPEALVETALELELTDGAVIADRLGEGPGVFLAGLYRAEEGVAASLLELRGGRPPWPPIDAQKAIPWVESQTGLTLAHSQKAALTLALSSKVLVITGGPGVGKTTLVNSILKILTAKKARVMLCAPTGRAAKRLMESTGIEAKTIHRLLETNPKTGGFRRNEEHPLECDLLVVDEISKRITRPSNNRLDDAVAAQVVKILRSTYADFGPTLATEKLRTKHGIDLAKETVRQLQIAVGLWIPRKLRPPKIQQPRVRRACLGELVQIDGCEHHWFEDRAPACTALVYVDDATSRLMHILFTGTESTFGYFEATRQYLGRYGKPLAFYSDKASIFRVNQASATRGDGHTQFGRALYELNIDGLCANTPAAKGRVERAHLTMQDRLVKELRLEGISTIEAANALMPTYIADYNGLFAKVPRDSHDAHRPVRADEDLDSIFSWREQRKVTSNLTLHYERKLYLLADTPVNRRYAGKYLEVFQFPDGRIEIRAGGVSVPYSTYDKLGAIDQGAIVENKRLGHALRISSIVQANRDNRSCAGPSTAHRIDGKRIPRKKLAGAKTQRELNHKDVQTALEVLN